MIQQVEYNEKMLKNKSIIYIVLLVSLMAIAFAQQPTLISLQGKLTNASTGARIISADLRVNINDSSGIVFNQNYSNAVSNGVFDLVLGSTYQLNLSYNEEYNLTLFVNNNSQLGEPFTFRGGQGQVGAGDIATTESYTFANVSVTGNFSINSNMSVDAGTLFVDAENNRVGIGTTTPGQKLSVDGNVETNQVQSFAGSSFTLQAAGGDTGSADVNILPGLIGGTYKNVVIANVGGPGGNVGIKDSDPDYPLEILSNSAPQFVISYDDGVDYATFAVDGDGDLTIAPSGGDTIISSSRVGIGTTTPSERLVVIGNISVPGTIFVDNESGRVGIGATSPNVTFHVSGSANITGTLSVGSFEMSNAGAGTMNVSGQTTLAFDAGNVGIGNTIPNNTLDVSGSVNITGNLTAGNNTLYVSEDGNVGIGTSSPGYPFVIKSPTGNLFVQHILSSDGDELITLEQVTTGGAGRLDVYDADDASAYTINGAAGAVFNEQGADLDFRVEAVGQAQALFVQGSDGNVGIGTTSPSEKLEVIGNFSIPGTLFVDNESGRVGIGNTIPNNTLDVSGSANVTGNLSVGDNGNALFVNGSGRVGIGTTGPDGTLHVHTATAGSVTPGAGEDDLVVENNDNGGISILVPDNADGRLGFGTPSDLLGAQLQWDYDINEFSMRTRKTGGFLRFDTDNGIEAMRISSSGNVGIGTTTPATTLDVKGKANFTGNFSVGETSNILFVDNTSGNVGIGTASPTSLLEVNGGDIELDSSYSLKGTTGDLQLKAPSSGHIKFWVEYAGTETYPNAKFEEDGTGNTELLIAGSSRITNSDTAEWGKLRYISGASPYFEVYSQQGDTVLGISGNVGIGTTSPSEKLEVIGNFSIPGTLFVDNESGRVGIGTTSPAEKLHVIGNVNVSGMIEANTINATERFVANNTLFVNNSMVGIGIDNPTHVLHVVGDANITGNLYLGKNLTDLAEYIFSEGDVEPADIVVISDYMKVKKSYKPYDKKAIGVISTEPAAVFGGGKGDVELAISGRVPVKATNENGAIEPGDLLTTSSTPGHAMKCTSIGKCFGNIIGKALTRLEGEKGTVIMIVMLN